MQSENTENSIDMNTNSKSCSNRRKRINRIKTIIVILVIILLILPTLCCIILGLQVSRLQNQVYELLRLHGKYELSYDSSGGDKYAFAAELEGKAAVDDYGHFLKLIEGDKGDADSKEETASQEEDLTQADTGQEVDLQKPQASSERKDEAMLDELNKDDKTKASDQDESSQKNGAYTDKKVYLTFDDGPSNYTDDILDILAEYKVKATFFVIGKTDSKSKELYQRIVDEGHTLGMHSYSHQYSKIYNSVEDFDKDFTKLWKLLYDTTGYKPSIFRFPGGSDNMVNKSGMEDFIHYLNETEIVYFDWNVLNGDATGVTYTKDQLIDNVLGGVATKDNSIVLLHDAQTKQTTIDSLPGLLDILISEGAQILPLDKDVSPIQMIKADTIK
ncbi:MAG: hypothetical protein K0R46_882 [Herbinix sp.]|nr:hypothetical protein [Herbinix sp.]